MDPFVAELADEMGVKSATLSRWVLAPEHHFGMELAKGANSTRRGRLPGRRPTPLAPNASSDPPVSPADAAPSSDVAEPEPTATKRPEPDLQRSAREDPPVRTPTTPRRPAASSAGSDSSMSAR